MAVADNLAAAVIRLIEAGFWPPNKELKEAGKFLENQDSEIARLKEDNDRLKAALNVFAKMGSKIAFAHDLPLIDYGNIQITYADLKRAADVLYGEGQVAQDKKE